MSEPNSERARCWAVATARWPSITVDAAAFWAAVETWAAGSDVLPSDDDAAELYLATACAAGDPAAHLQFERAYLGAIDGAIARFRLGRAVRDELVQRLRERFLLAAPGTTPAVMRYAGRGLARVVRVAAVRVALDQCRGVSVDGEDPDAIVAARRDPALELMHRAYAGAFKGAFEAAIEALSARERTLLRLHLVDGLSVDDLAALYGIHRATAARRLAAARDQVAVATRRHLRGSGIDRAEMEEGFALVASQLDLSIARILDDS